MAKKSEREIELECAIRELTYAGQILKSQINRSKSCCNCENCKIAYGLIDSVARIVGVKYVQKGKCLMSPRSKRSKVKTKEFNPKRISQPYYHQHRSGTKLAVYVNHNQ